MRLVALLVCKDQTKYEGVYGTVQLIFHGAKLRCVREIKCVQQCWKTNLQCLSLYKDKDSEWIKKSRVWYST